MSLLYMLNMITKNQFGCNKNFESRESEAFASHGQTVQTVEHNKWKLNFMKPVKIIHIHPYSWFWDLLCNKSISSILLTYKILYIAFDRSQIIYSLEKRFSILKASHVPLKLVIKISLWKLLKYTKSCAGRPLILIFCANHWKISNLKEVYINGILLSLQCGQIILNFGPFFGMLWVW